MAYCSQCAEPLASEARFCHKCGAAAAATAPNATIIGAPLPVAAKKPRPVAKILGALIGLGVLCALAYLGGRQAGWFGRAEVKTPSGANPLSATMQPPEGANPLRAEIQPNSGANPLHAEIDPGQPPKEPPKDVLDWLEHLRRIEMKRRAMRNDFSPALDMLRTALGMKTEIDLDEMEQKKQGLDENYHKYAQNWYDLLKDYASVRPPQQCATLAASYDTALRRYVEAMIRIQDSMRKEDISELMKMRGGEQGQVDSLLIEADENLRRLAREIGIRKPFAIQPDASVDSMVGLGF